MADASECEKLSKVAAQSQKCGEFLEWLLERYSLCEVHKHDNDCEDCGYLQNDLVLIHVNVQKLLAEFFGIDLKKLEEEKMEFLTELRQNNV